MKAFILGFVAGILAVPIFGALFLRFGPMPVATTDPPFPLEKRLARTALGARIDREMPRTVPIPTDEANLTAGATLYREQCAVCHGLPEQSATAVAKGMFPPPPQLFKGKGVTDDPPGETYWKVANGIRLTGMPGFGASLKPDQMWQISLVLAHADKLPPATLAVLKR